MLPDSVDVVVHGAPVGISAEGCIHQVEWITQHFAHISFTTVGEGPMMIGGLPAYTHTYTWRRRRARTDGACRHALSQNTNVS